MDKTKEESKEKKIYEKPVLTRVELIAKEAVLGVCKFGNGNLLLCDPDVSCAVSGGSRS